MSAALESLVATIAEARRARSSFATTEREELLSLAAACRAEVRRYWQAAVESAADARDEEGRAFARLQADGPGAVEQAWRCLELAAKFAGWSREFQCLARSALRQARRAEAQARRYR